MSTTALLWQPTPERIANATVTTFAQRVSAAMGRAFPEYAALWQWSVDEPEAFWCALWDHAGIVGERGSRTLIDAHRMPGARWFPDARLNFAENLLARSRVDDSSDALVFRGEDRASARVSHAQLIAATSQFAQALAALGVGIGDRVAAYMPNMPEAVIATLGTTSLGAIWSSCSPDFGIQGVLDRFGQIEPRVLVTVDGYWYNGKAQPVIDRVREIASKLPSLERIVVIPYLEQSGGGVTALDIPKSITWSAFIGAFAPAPIPFARLPFDHPVYILYSSGTTGVPKCIVHGAGGTLLQHVKEIGLHGDVKPGDRLFYFTTCGWMMWNWLVSGLAVGATLLLYDGSPFVARGKILWEFAESEGLTHFGTSAKYIDAMKKIALVPRKDFGLAPLRTMFSTGSPLAPESFDYVYQCVKEDLCLSSISGGTDIVSCFALGVPTRAVWRGELQCRGLGMAVDVYDDEAKPVRGRKGELVCTKPFPSMPIGFWNDPDGSRYHAAYFDRFPGVWCHGDFVELTEHDGLIIYGRSDATLNPGGVRIGTAEIYRQVEQLDEVLESLAIAQNWPPDQIGDVRVVLFVRLRDGLVLDETLSEKIKQQIRLNTTPRHVPAKVVQVTDIPRTKSNKIVELAVRDVVHGLPVDNLDALANPEALEEFRDRPELRG